MLQYVKYILLIIIVILVVVVCFVEDELKKDNAIIPVNSKTKNSTTDTKSSNLEFALSRPERDTVNDHGFIDPKLLVKEDYKPFKSEELKFTNEDDVNVRSLKYSEVLITLFKSNDKWISVVKEYVVSIGGGSRLTVDKNREAFSLTLSLFISSNNETLKQQDLNDLKKCIMDLRDS